jgi:hypothetical protein
MSAMDSKNSAVGKRGLPHPILRLLIEAVFIESTPASVAVAVSIFACLVILIECEFRVLCVADRLKRVPLVLSVALLYTCMAAPTIFHLQTPSAYLPLTYAGIGNAPPAPLPPCSHQIMKK